MTVYRRDGWGIGATLLAALAGIGATAVSSCSSAGKSASSGGNRIATARSSAVGVLAHDEAQARAKQIQRPTYSLWFGLDDEHEDFEGRAVVNFDLRPKAGQVSKSIWLDFEGGKIRTLSVNGVARGNPEYDGHRIRFAVADLQPGANRIEIAFSHPYGKHRHGLVRFKDPEDGQSYLHSNLEPYAAREIFPCFDQPDLKASFELTVEAPEEWQVISNRQEREVTTIGGRKSWAFPPSPLLSTYVFALHAGPFRTWTSTAEGVTLRLFARETMANLAEAQASDLFKVTAQGMEFFTLQFAYPFPYSKYDQILVPEFRGGMENAGAVTLSEDFLFRSAPTKDARWRRNSTVLHELAHMWFGDLVTLRWWNSLWLNESLATYLEAWAQAGAQTGTQGGAQAAAPGTPGAPGGPKPDDMAWRKFFSMKTEAYWEDALVTTHPIETPVPDTEHADNSFDGITYGKGAAALRQLAFLLGEDDFREGLQRHLLKHALRNATTHEFIKVLSEASGQDLAKWQKAWLQTPGTNTLRADWACEDGKITRFNLVQGGDPLRTHRTRIGLFRVSKGGKAALQAYEKLDVRYAQSETPVTQALKKPCPDFVDPNLEDFDFVKVELDPVSLAQARGGLAQFRDGLAQFFDDPFVRQTLWHTLWLQVLDGKFPAREYAEQALKTLSREKDYLILSDLLPRMIHVSPTRLTVAKVLPTESARAEFRAKLEELALHQLEQAAPGSEAQLLWFEALLNSASTPRGVDALHALLQGKKKLRGLALAQDRRWQVLQAIARNTGEERLPEVEDLIDQELKKDPGESGQSAALAARVLIAEQGNKKRWLERVLKTLSGAPENTAEAPALTSWQFRIVTRNLLVQGQEVLIRQSADSFFGTIRSLADAAEESPANASRRELAGQFVRNLFPALCEPGVALRAGEALAANPGLPPAAVRWLKVYKQEEERCVNARTQGEK